MNRQLEALKILHGPAPLPRAWAAVDPGLTGSIAFLRPDGSLLELWDMPTMKLGKSGRVNGAELANIFSSVGARCKEDQWSMHVAIERVQAMSKAGVKQGVASAFNFGHGAGVIEGVVAALGLPYELVTPQTWKRHFGLLGLAKEASRAKAIQLYPVAPLGLKKYVGRAEALLIARFALERSAERATGAVA